MSLRDYIADLERSGKLAVVREPVSKAYEMAGILKKLEPRPVLFEKVKESEFRVIGNLFCGKGSFAEYLRILPPQIIATMTNAIANPSRPAAWNGGTPPCQEVVDLKPDLDSLPILFHCEGDGGNYISSGVFLAKHPAHGQNADFHRAMQFSKTEMAIRVVPGRHFDCLPEGPEIPRCGGVRRAAAEHPRRGGHLGRPWI